MLLWTSVPASSVLSCGLPVLLVFSVCVVCHACSEVFKIEVSSVFL